MDKTEIQIKGMHCSSCELLVEDELLEVSGVKSAKVNYREGKAQADMSLILLQLKKAYL